MSEPPEKDSPESDQSEELFLTPRGTLQQSVSQLRTEQNYLPLNHAAPQSSALRRRGCENSGSSIASHFLGLVQTRSSYQTVDVSTSAIPAVSYSLLDSTASQVNNLIEIRNQVQNSRVCRQAPSQLTRDNVRDYSHFLPRSCPNFLVSNSINRLQIQNDQWNSCRQPLSRNYNNHSNSLRLYNEWQATQDPPINQQPYQQNLHGRREPLESLDTNNALATASLLSDAPNATFSSNQITPSLARTQCQRQQSSSRYPFSTSTNPRHAIRDSVMRNLTSHSTHAITNQTAPSSFPHQSYRRNSICQVREPPANVDYMNCPTRGTLLHTSHRQSQPQNQPILSSLRRHEFEENPSVCSACWERRPDFMSDRKQNNLSGDAAKLHQKLNKKPTRVKTCTGYRNSTREPENANHHFGEHQVNSASCKLGQLERPQRNRSNSEKAQENRIQAICPEPDRTQLPQHALAAPACRFTKPREMHTKSQHFPSSHRSQKNKRHTKCKEQERQNENGNLSRLSTESCSVTELSNIASSKHRSSKCNKNRKIQNHSRRFVRNANNSSRTCLEKNYYPPANSTLSNRPFLRYRENDYQISTGSSGCHSNESLNSFLRSTQIGLSRGILTPQSVLWRARQSTVNIGIHNHQNDESPPPVSCGRSITERNNPTRSRSTQRASDQARRSSDFTRRRPASGAGTSSRRRFGRLEETLRFQCSILNDALNERIRRPVDYRELINTRYELLRSYLFRSMLQPLDYVARINEFLDLQWQPCISSALLLKRFDVFLDQAISPCFTYAEPHLRIMSAFFDSLFRESCDSFNRVYSKVYKVLNGQGK